MNADMVQGVIEAYRSAQSNHAFQARYLDEVQWLAWYDIADPFIEQHPLALVLAHPGSGKSTLISYIRTLRRICQDRNVRIGYFSKTAAKASLFMTNVGRELRFNRRIVHDFGPFIDEKNPACIMNTEQIRVLGCMRGKATPTLINLGVSSQYESLRFDMLILDDPVDLKTSISPAETDRMDKTLGSLMDRLDPGGQLIITGHLFWPNDFYEQVMEHRPQIEVLRLPAAHAPGDYFTPDDNGTPMAAEIWTGQRLFTEKRDRHKPWEWKRWYQQISFNPDEATFGNIPRQTTRDRPAGLVWAAADPAYSTAGTSDWSVAMAGVPYKGGLLVLNMADWRINSGWSMAFAQFARQAGSGCIQVEINNAQTLGEEMRDLVKRQRWDLQVRDLRSKGAKEYRIGELASEAAAGRLWFHEDVLGLPCYERLTHEWNAYPNVLHDDHLDCLEMLWTLVMSQPKRARPAVGVVKW